MRTNDVNELHQRFISCGLPEYMWGGMQRYLFSGIPPGHFLTAVLCNDLRECIGRADDTNVRLLREYVLFLYNDTPSGCWGSEENYRAWIERGGLQLTE